MLGARSDKVFRVLMPLVVYPLSTLGLLTWAATESMAIGLSLCVMAILVPVAWGIHRVRSMQHEFVLQRYQLGHALADAADGDLDDQSEKPLLKDAFQLFDLDHSGTIDDTELGSLMNAMYPGAPHAHRKNMFKILPTAEHENGIHFHLFDDAILALRAYVAENDPSGAWRSHTARAQISPINAMKKISQKTPNIVFKPADERHTGFARETMGSASSGRVELTLQTSNQDGKCGPSSSCV
jgi:hypothetical protein